MVFCVKGGVGGPTAMLAVGLNGVRGMAAYGGAVRGRDRRSGLRARKGDGRHRIQAEKRVYD